MSPAVVNFTDAGHFLIAMAYYAVTASLIAVAWIAYQKRGILRLIHPLVWLGAAMFFLGCGSHHIDFMYHHIRDEAVDYNSLHHNSFIVMQILGVLPFLAVLRLFVKRLQAVEVTRR